MYLELKGIFIIIGMGLTSVVMALFLLDEQGFFFGFLLLMGMIFYLIGDMILFAKMITSQANRVLEPCKPDQEKCVLFDLAHNMTFQVCNKKEDGKREFTRYKKEASIINRGKYPIRFPNGDRGFVGHESYDLDVDLYETEALDKLPGDDIKEIYRHLKGEQKK